MNRAAMATLDRNDTVTTDAVAAGLPVLFAPGTAVHALRRSIAGNG